LDISIPPEGTIDAVLDFDGLLANTNHTTAGQTAAPQSSEDSNSFQLEQLNSSPGRSPHASKAGWTVSGSEIVSLNYRDPVA